MKIEPGQRWLEKRTGRVIVILQEEVYSTGPSWKWESPTPNEEAINWHYCDVRDFTIWGRFELLKGEIDERNNDTQVQS